VKRAILVVVMVCATLALAAPASAEGWKLPNLNPFSKTSSKGTQTTRARPAVSPSRAAEPSFLEKVNTGTKEFFTKTGDFLMPWKKSDKKPSASRTTTAARPAGKKSIFPWAGDKKETEPEPQSLTDWLAQPKEKY
jgi:hypothetical protein